jgi:adenylate cyclase
MKMKQVGLPSLRLPISFEPGTLRQVGLGRWTARLIGLALLGGFLVLRAWDPVPVQTVRLKVFDLYQLLHPRSVSSYPVVIIDIDEESLATHGQWPWPRNLVADMTRTIFQSGAIALAFDVVFAEPDRLSPAQLAENMADLDDAFRQELRKMPDNDAILAEMFGKTRVVAGEAVYSAPVGNPHKPLQKASIATLGGDPQSLLPHFQSLVGNIPDLEASARGLGVFTFQPAVDGVVRRVPTMVVVEEAIRPSLSLELLRVATGQTTYAIKSDAAGIRSIVIAGVEIPTDRNGRIWVHYGPHDRQRYVSAGDLISGKINHDRLAGKLVLVGTSAVGLQDIKSTPLRQTMPGVEIHAQIVEAILAGTHLLRPHYALGAELALTAAVGLIVILLIPVLGALWTLVVGGVIGFVVMAASWYFYTEQLLLLDASYALFSSFAVYSLLSYLNYVREEQQRQQVRGAFSQYLSPLLVQELADHPERLKLGGETRDMSILFSDVRGFTSISEQLKDNPQDLTSLINSLLTPLTEVVLNHRGTIDKYMGDCIMAFWNAPFSDSKHVHNACLAALEMLNVMESLNAAIAEQGAAGHYDLDSVQIGIGINSGPCVVGNMGSAQRFDYTVLGDVVNMASRLEGQTKAYGVDIIVGESTAKVAADSFALLELDRVRVVGKETPERIYALMGDGGVLRSREFLELREVLETLLRHYRSQDWPAARATVATASAFSRSSKSMRLFTLYEERIDQLEANPPGPDWDGVTVALVK